MRRAAMGNLVKTALSLTLLGAVVLFVGPRDVLAALGGMSSLLVAGAFALLLAEALVRAVNWFQLTRSVGCGLSLGSVSYAYFVGGFLGALLPSTVGTDIARSAVAAARTSTRVEPLLATTAVLNLLSLVVLSGIALAACAWALARPDAPGGVVAASAAASGACLLAVAALRALASSERAGRFAQAAPAAAGFRARLRNSVARFMAVLGMLPKGAALASVTAVAACSYLLRSLGWLAALAAAGVQVPWPVLLTIGPLVTLGAALPISILGFGGFQAISVFLLAQWGVPAEQALAASLVQSSLAVLLHGIGCLVYLAGGRMSVAPLRASGGVS